MAGDYGLRDIRFVGYDNGKLADQVEGLRNGGSGSESFYRAVGALVAIADGLAETDQTLREQLEEIGVTWQGEAAEGGTEATEGATIYAEDAQGPVTDSAKGVDSQGATFTTTRNSAPESSTLRGPTEENGVDQFMGFLGHTTDHAKDVKATNAARDQAVDSLNSYQAGSSDALNRSQSLPVPPGMNLNAQPVEHGTTTPSVASYNPSGGVNTLSGGNISGATGLPPGGGGGVPPAPTTGGNPPLTGAPQPGIGPNPTGVPPGPNPALPAAARAFSPLMMAEAATMMGAGGIGGAGAGADSERAGRGGQGGSGSQARGPVKGGTPIGSAPDDEARAARNAERFGAKTGRPAGSIMQPAAAAGQRAEGEEDKEHVRRYGVESGDVFDDDRVVAPESIGDEDDDRAI